MALPTAFARLRGNELTSRVQDQVATTLNPVAQAVASTPIMGAPAPSWIPLELTALFAQNTAYKTSGYHKDALGYTHLLIALTSAAGAGALTTMFTLAAGYRPDAAILVPAIGAGLTVSSLIVNPTGVVQNGVALGAGGAIWAYFSFLAEQ